VRFRQGGRGRLRSAGARSNIAEGILNGLSWVNPCLLRVSFRRDGLRRRSAKVSMGDVSGGGEGIGSPEEGGRDLEGG